MLKSLLVSILFLVPGLAWAKYFLPTGLDSSGQQTVARDFGFGSATKMNADPTPLGGYEGFQLAASRDFVDVSRIRKIGTGATQDDFFVTSTIMVGKGLYYNVDTFFQMTPPQNGDFTSYGALLRFSFFDYDTLSLHFGGLVHGSLSQFQNIFGATIYGADLYSYLNIKNLVFTVGLGQAKGICTYIGNGLASPLTTDNVKVDLTSSHMWTGISYRWQRWVVSVIAEDYFDLLYSTKLAYNF